MMARAIAASVPFKWVAGDTVYGVGDIEQQLRKAGKGYVVGCVHCPPPWQVDKDRKDFFRVVDDNGIALASDDLQRRRQKRKPSFHEAEIQSSTIDRAYAALSARRLLASDLKI
jgi:hypothetical protein